MKVNGKEIGFLYTVGALCDYTDWCVSNPKKSTVSASLVKAEYMSREFARANGTKDIVTADELRKLLPYELEEILAEVQKAEEKGSRRQIETTDAPKKKDAN